MFALAILPAQPELMMLNCDIAAAGIADDASLTKDPYGAVAARLQP